MTTSFCSSATPATILPLSYNPPIMGDDGCIAAVDTVGSRENLTPEICHRISFLQMALYYSLIMHESVQALETLHVDPYTVHRIPIIICRSPCTV